MIRNAENYISCYNNFGSYGSKLKDRSEPLDLSRRGFKLLSKPSPYSEMPGLMKNKLKNRCMHFRTSNGMGNSVQVQIPLEREPALHDARNWLKSLVSTNPNSVFTLFAIVSAYSQICSDVKLMSFWALLELICSELSEISGKVNALLNLRSNLQTEITISDFRELSKDDSSVLNDASLDNKRNIITLTHDLMFQKLPLKKEDGDDRCDSDDSGFDSPSIEDADSQESKRVDLKERKQVFAYDSKQIMKQEASSETNNSDVKSNLNGVLQRKPESDQSSVSEEALKIIRVDSSSGSVTENTSAPPPNGVGSKDLGTEEHLPREEEAVSSVGTKRKWSSTQENIIKNFSQCLDLEEYKNSGCYEYGQKLSQLLIEMLRMGQLNHFLSTFVHSATCSRQHGTMCSMFQRIIRHVSSPPHFCAVRKTYGHILRLHLDTCRSEECHFPNCHKLRELRQNSAQKRS